MKDWRVLITAIIAIAILEAIALIMGRDGALFAGVVGVIGAIAGVSIPRILKK